MALTRGERTKSVTQSSLASRMGVVKAFEGDGFSMAADSIGKTLGVLGKMQADIEESDWKSKFTLDGFNSIKKFAFDNKFDSGSFMSAADSYIQTASNEAPRRFQSWAKQYLGMQAAREYEQIANNEWVKRLDTSWQNFNAGQETFITKYGDLILQKPTSEHQKIYGEQIIPELGERYLIYQKLYNSTPPSANMVHPEQWLKQQKLVIEEARLLSKAKEIQNMGIAKGDIVGGFLDAQEFLRKYKENPDVYMSGNTVGAIAEENPFTLVDTDPADRDTMVSNVGQELAEYNKLETDKISHALSQEETKMIALYNQDITDKTLVGSLAHPLTKAITDLKILEKKEYWIHLDEAQKIDVLNKQQNKQKIQTASMKLLTDGSNLRFEDALANLDGIENAEAQLMEHMVMQEIFLTGGDPNKVNDADALFSDTTSIEYNALINVSKKAGRFDKYSSNWLSSLSNLNVDSIEESGILGKMLTFYDMVNHGEKNIIGKELPNGLSKVLHDASKEWKKSQFFRKPENSRHFATWVYARLHPDEKILEKRADAFNSYINNKGVGSVDYLKEEFMKEFVWNIRMNKNPISHITKELMTFMTGGLVTDPDTDEFTQFAPAGMDWKGFLLHPVSGFDKDKMLQFSGQAEEFLVEAIDRLAPLHLSNDPTDAEIKDSMPFILNSVFAELNNNGYGVSTMSGFGDKPTLSQFPIEYEYKHLGKKGIAEAFANDYLINNYKAEMILSDPDATESDKDDALFYLQSLRGTNDMGELNPSFTEKEILDMVKDNQISFSIDDDTIRDAEEKGYKVQYRLNNIPTMFEPFDADRSLDDSELRFYPDSQDYNTINYLNQLNFKKLQKENALEAARTLVPPEEGDSWAMTVAKNFERNIYSKLMEVISSADEWYQLISGEQVADKMTTDRMANLIEGVGKISGMNTAIISHTEMKKEVRLRMASEFKSKTMEKLNDHYFRSEGGFYNDGFVFDGPRDEKTVGTGIALEFFDNGVLKPHTENRKLLERYGYNVQDILDGKTAITAKHDFQMRQELFETHIEKYVKPDFGWIYTDTTRDWSNVQVVLADMSMEAGVGWFKLKSGKDSNFTKAINNHNWNKAIFELINDTGNNIDRNIQRAKILSAYLPTKIDLDSYKVDFNNMPEGINSKGAYLNLLRKDESYWKHLNTLTGLNKPQ